jgi:anti-anti-sigma factor
MDYQITRQADATEIHLKGRMEFSDHDAFRKVLSAFDGPPGHRIVFNLAGLEFVDSCGLGMFIIAREQAQKTGVKLSIENVQMPVRRAMELARFARFFDIRP